MPIGEWGCRNLLCILKYFQLSQTIKYNNCVLSNSRIGLQVSRATVSDNAWIPEGFYDFVINALRFPPKSPKVKL